MTRTTARQVLRTATSDDHDRVDAAFARFDLADRDDYIRFLLAQAEAFLPVEGAIDDADAAAILPDWPARRRSALLLDDLRRLGAAPAPAQPGSSFRSREEIFGAIYVLEGSRLGGRLLERSVPADLPRSFIGTTDNGLWRNLIEVLDTQLLSEDQHRLAIGAARRVFALFEAGALRHGKATKLG